MRSHPVSLSEAAPEEDYRITRFLFGMVRDRCWSLGLHVGSRIRCRHRSPGAVKLELGDGRRVTLEHPYARFVEAAPEGGVGGAAGGP